MEPFYDRVKPRHLTGAQLDILLARGWYRMHQDLFTISHLAEDHEFYRVHWLRYPIKNIIERPSHRRIRKNHEGYRVVIEPLVSIPSAHRELHRIYRKWIDFDGVHTIEEALYGAEGNNNIFQTHHLSVYFSDHLIAAGYFDVGDAGLASILHFFDPGHRWSSPGKFLILLTLDFMRQQGMTFYYPGYVVAGKPKMDYKLFLGEDSAEYFNPKSGLWLPFHRDLLKEQPLSFPIDIGEDDDEPADNRELHG